MRLPGVDYIIHFHLFLVGVRSSVNLHAHIHKASIDEGLLQLAARSLSEGLAVDYRRLPHLLQPAVVPFGIVLACQAIGRELQFGETKHLVIGLLAQEIVEFEHLYRIVVDFYRYFIQEIFPVGHMLGGAAGSHKGA